MAYNEFCAPTLEESVEELIKKGATHITVTTTMFTPGGSHSEVEIPEILDHLRPQSSRGRTPVRLAVRSESCREHVGRASKAVFREQDLVVHLRGNGEDLIYVRKDSFWTVAKCRMGNRVVENYPSYRMLPFKVQLAKAFHETHSFKWDPVTGFTLASGLRSPFYVDCRSLMAHPRSRRLVANLAYESLQPVELDCLGGLEIGAISIATSISDFAFVAQPPRTWRTFVVRKQAKDHGLGNLSRDRFNRGSGA